MAVRVKLVLRPLLQVHVQDAGTAGAPLHCREGWQGVSGCGLQRRGHLADRQRPPEGRRSVLPSRLRLLCRTAAAATAGSCQPHQPSCVPAHALCLVPTWSAQHLGKRSASPGGARSQPCAVCGSGGGSGSCRSVRRSSAAGAARSAATGTDYAWREPCSALADCHGAGAADCERSSS